MGEIIIEEMNYKAFLIVFANSLLLIAACTITLYGFTVHRLSYWVPGLILTVVLLLWFIASLSKALQIRKLITITYEGIVDDSSLGGVGFIPYDDIKEFLIITINEKRAIAIIPKNIDKFLLRFNVMKRRLMKRNLGVNLPPVTIFVDMAKDMDPEDILTLLQKRLSDYSSLYS